MSERINLELPEGGILSFPLLGNGDDIQVIVHCSLPYDETVLSFEKGDETLRFKDGVCEVLTELIRDCAITVKVTLYGCGVHLWRDNLQDQLYKPVITKRIEINTGRETGSEEEVCREIAKNLRRTSNDTYIIVGAGSALCSFWKRRSFHLRKNTVVIPVPGTKSQVSKSIPRRGILARILPFLH